MNEIAFSDKDLVRTQNPHDDIVIISMTTVKHEEKQILVDSESSADILFYDIFIRMNLPERQLRRVSTPLVGFSSNLIGVEGEIILAVLLELHPD